MLSLPIFVADVWRELNAVALCFSQAMTINDPANIRLSENL